MPGVGTGPLPSTAVLEFWRAAGPGKWFAKDDAFDEAFRARFLGVHEAVAVAYDPSWLADAGTALSLVLLLDQFPRNCFRDSPRMYASDDKAQVAADAAIAAGHHLKVEPELRVFFSLPFTHAEDLASQERGVAFATPVGGEALKAAKEHRDIIKRFGRFPHRNEILGRASTDDEKAFLAAGGFAG
ncbi:MAG TPA: DUF924 family protein [Myxococcota bacterium]